MLTEPQVTARYLEPFTKRKILRDHLEGTRIWRIARDIRQSPEVVIEVLVASGFSRGLAIQHSQHGRSK